MTASCSNPFLQIWKDGIKPLYDTKDDMRDHGRAWRRRWPRRPATSGSPTTGSSRSRARPEVYLQRLLDASTTTTGYNVDDIMAGKYGEPGAALMMFRTYPRIPFWEQIHDNVPFYTDTGRLNAYCDIPEAIEYGENFIVHREGPEATPYLPNVIVSSNPLDPAGRLRHRRATSIDAEMRTVRNIKMPWARGEEDEEPALGAGLPLLLPDAEDAPPRPLVLGGHRLARASGRATSATRTASTSGCPASATTSCT